MWTKEAEELLKEVPDFVRERFRQKVETEASKQNLKCIDRPFVKKLQSPHNHKSPPPKITENPLGEAFARKFAIHAGISGGETITGDKEATLKEELVSNEGMKQSMAYIHIPFCSSRCLFCGFYSENSIPETMAQYAQVLRDEIAMSGQWLRDANQVLSAVYFGGGTPTDLSSKDLGALVHSVRTELPLSDDCEITLEGRLFGFDDEKVETVLEAGVNRFSFGVQAFDTDIRQRVGRKQPRAEIIERLNTIVQASKPYNAAVIIDLIYGLPGQCETAWLNDIDCAVKETDIHGLDLYQINLIPGTPLSQIKNNMPHMADIKEQSQLFSSGRKRMLNLGFERLSIAHWRRSPVERNRYNSWNKIGHNCMPLGCGAGGRWGNSRFFQENRLQHYTEKISAGNKPLAMAMKIPQHYSVTSIAVGQLEQRHLDLNILEETAGTPLKNRIRPLIKQWDDAGLLRLGQNDRARLTEAGEFWVVNLQHLIDAELKDALCET